MGTSKCGYCIGPLGARLPHCQGKRCQACEECGNDAQTTTA